jgi:hypothetical protein
MIPSFWFNNIFVSAGMIIAWSAAYALNPYTGVSPAMALGVVAAIYTGAVVLGAAIERSITDVVIAVAGVAVIVTIVAAYVSPLPLVLVGSLIYTWGVLGMIKFPEMSFPRAYLVLVPCGTALALASPWGLKWMVTATISLAVIQMLVLYWPIRHGAVRG